MLYTERGRMDARPRVTLAYAALIVRLSLLTLTTLKADDLHTVDDRPQERSGLVELKRTSNRDVHGWEHEPQDLSPRCC